MAKAALETGLTQADFQAAQDLSLDGFALLSPVRQEGEIVDFVWRYINPAGLKILRLKKDSVLGQSFKKTFPVAEKAGLLADYKKVIESGQGLDTEVRYQTSKLTGWWRNMAVSVSGGIALTFRDITERKLWEERLKQLESRFRLIAEANLFGLFFWDEEGIILDGNEEFERLTGFSQEELKKRPVSWKEITPKEFWELDQQALAEMRRTGLCRPYEKECQHQDGRRTAVVWGGARLPALSFEGMAFLLDISERKEAEKQREILLGHELKTPLAAIKGFSQLLKSRVKKKAIDKDGQILDYLARIESKADFLTELISDFSDLSRLRAGKLKIEKEVFDFDQLVTELVDDFRGQTNHQLKITGRSGKFILADRGRIAQVISNLLSNAIKYSPEAKRIKIRLASTRQEVSLSVQDFGCGIPEGEQKRLFEPFFRASSTKERPGVGLGLYISQEIVRAHQGQLWAESKEGEGSVFRLTLPVKKASQGTKPPPEPERQPLSP